MNTPTNTSNSTYTLLYVGAASGLAVFNVLEFIDAGQYTLLLRALAVMLIGGIAAVALKNAVRHPFAVAIIAASYVHALSLLLSATQYIHYGLYLFLGVIISAGVFYINAVWFATAKPSKTTKLIVAATVWMLFYIICALVNVYIDRRIASAYL